MCKTPTAIDPRQAAHLVFETMNGRELKHLLPWLAENSVFHFPGTKPIVGPDRIERFIKVLFHRYPELRFTVERIIVDESCAAVEWTNRGIDRRDVLYANAGVTVIELVAGQIAYLSDTFKDTAIFSR
jgi:ketosteroid isomerase-like protein